MKCVACGVERPGITAHAYGMSVLVCNECMREGVGTSARALGRLIKKKAPKAFKALAAVANISKAMR